MWVRLVEGGATPMPVPDAHREGGVFTANQLLDYRNAKLPPDEQEAIKRRNAAEANKARWSQR